MNIKRFIISILLIISVVNTTEIISRDGCAKGWHKKKGICVKNNPCAKGWYRKNGICLKKNADDVNSYMGCAPGWHKKNGICVADRKQRITILNNYGTVVHLVAEWVNVVDRSKSFRQFAILKLGERITLTGTDYAEKLRKLSVGTVKNNEYSKNEYSKSVNKNRYFVITASEKNSEVSGQKQIVLTGYKDEAAYKASKPTDEEKSTDEEFFADTSSDELMDDEDSANEGDSLDNIEDENLAVA